MSVRALSNRAVLPAWAVMSSPAQSWLWWAAVALMVVDHVGAVLLPGTITGEALRAVGRLGSVLFGGMIGYNIGFRGVQPTRYYRSLGIGYLVSLAPYAWVFGGVLNIFATLLLGVLVVDVVLYRRSAWWLLLVAVLGPVVSYGLAGVLLPLAVVLAVRWPHWSSALLLVAVALGLNWGSPWFWVPLLVPLLIEGVHRLPVIGRFPSWAKVGFYPVHLLVLGVMRGLL